MELARPAVFSLDGFVNFLPMHRNFERCLDTEPHFVATHIDDGDNNVVTDDDAFITLSRED
jgi:hypothetical protein